MAEGVDISEHQGNVPAEWFDQWQYAILRAYNENGYKDQWIDANWRKAEGRTKRGIYGWPIPGADNFALGRQLVTSYPGAEAGYWADRERSGRGLATDSEVDAYVRGIEAAGGVARGFYSNNPECAFTPYLDSQCFWMADYGQNDGYRHDPWEQWPYPARDYVIHQYSSAGGLDRNWSPNMDWAGGAPTPEPEPERKKDDMWIALILGIDGNVHAYGTDGCVRVIEYGGPPGAYGIPQEALDSGLYMRNMTDEKFEGQSSWDRLLAAEKAALTQPSSGGEPVPPADIKAIPREDFAKETNRRLGKDELEIDGGPGATFVVT